MKKVFIINSKANSNEIKSLCRKIESFFPDAIIEWTKYPHHATQIARSYAKLAPRPIHIFACDGDGLLHEVINGIVNASNVLLSIVPIGTGNDFIKSLYPYKKSDFWDFKNYEDPILRPCDVMKADQEYAINTISFGFDVHVAKAVNHYEKKAFLKGILPYYLGMLRSLNKPLNQEHDIKIDADPTRTERYAFLVLCNGKYYGGGYLPCPNAQWDDGWIDLCLIKNVKKLQILRFSKLYEKGEHIKKLANHVTIEKGKWIKIDTHKKGVEANLDGEVRRLVDPTITIVPHAITLCLPYLEEVNHKYE